MARRRFLSATIQNHVVPLMRFISIRRVELHIEGDPLRFVLPRFWAMSTTSAAVAVASTVPEARSNVWQLRAVAGGTVTVIFNHTVLSIQVTMTVFVVA